MAKKRTSKIIEAVRETEAGLRKAGIEITHRVLSDRDAAVLVAGLLGIAPPNKRLATAAQDYLRRVDRAIRSVDRTLAAVKRSEQRIRNMESAGRKGKQKAPVRHADLDHLAGTMTKKEAAGLESLIAEQRKS